MSGDIILKARAISPAKEDYIPLREILRRQMSNAYWSH